MNLPILLFFGIVGTVYAAYKIPEHDYCVLKVLLCDDFLIPLTPTDNSTLEMFQTIGELNAICDELERFRRCLKNAETFCKEKAVLDVGFELLRNRRLAFDLCKRGSNHQHVYMMVEECVNEYSHSAIEFCTDKAVETVGLNFYLGDYDSECRFLGAIQHCHVAVITDKCGGIAGNMLEKLAIYRGQRDFLCIDYEEERLKNLKEFHDKMDSYVQQYRDKVSHFKTEDKSGQINGAKSFQTSSQEDSSQFHHRISPVSNEYTSNSEHTLDLNISNFPEEPPLCFSSLSGYKIIDSEYKFQNTNRHSRHFYKQPSPQILSDENYVCKTKASFLLMEIRPNGEHSPLGYGVANVLWSKFIPLKDIFCVWMMNLSAPVPLGKCSILIDDSLASSKGCTRKMDDDLPFNATIAVYENFNEREAERVARLRVHSFFKYSPALKRRLGAVVNFFKNNAHDIRFWSAEQFEANLYKEPNNIHSTNRIGIVQSDVDNGIKSERSINFYHKYNFYKPEQEEYLIDTEIHLISPEKGGLSNEFDIGDVYAYQNYDETLNPSPSDETSGESIHKYSYDELSTPRPSIPPKSGGSYRPYDLFRPRVGEIVEEHSMSREDLGLQDADEREFNPNVLFEDITENGFTSHLHAKEMCPVLPDNISKLDDIPDRYSRLNFMDRVDPLDLVESKHYKKIPLSKTRKDIPSIHTILKAEGPENIASDNKQNPYEEIYVVTPSTVIETSSLPKRTLSEYVAQNSRILNKQDDRKDSVEFSKESNSKDSTLEKDCHKNLKSSGVDFLELISNYQTHKH